MSDRLAEIRARLDWWRPGPDKVLGSTVTAQLIDDVRRAPDEWVRLEPAWGIGSIRLCIFPLSLSAPFPFGVLHISPFVLCIFPPRRTLSPIEMGIASRNAEERLRLEADDA